MATTIRRLMAADAEIYHAIRMRMLAERPETFLISVDEEAGVDVQRERLAKKEQRDDDVLFAAFDGDALVGTAGLFRTMPHRAKARHKATIWGVYVAPEARGKGIGRRLMDTAIEAARNADGIELIQLGVASTSGAARALYAACGFETWGIEKNAVRIDGRYVDDEMMVLFL